MIFRAATVYPGDRAPIADVAVGGREIVAVARGLDGEDVIEAAGLMLHPGFIDMHAHSALRSFDDPHRCPEGVGGVWVAGQAVWRHGGPTGARPGGVPR